MELTDELPQLVAATAPVLAEQLLSAAAKGGVEADLVRQCDSWLGDFAKAARINWNVSAERRVVFREAESGRTAARIDRLFNSVVVEFEPPGCLKATNEAGANRHAIGQVEEQIDNLVRTEGWTEDKVSGVVLDGAHFIFMRRTAGHWIVEAPVEVDAHSTARFLRLLASLSRQPLLPETVLNRFGIKQADTAVKTVHELYNALLTPSHPRAEALFTQWREFYRDVAGLDADRLAGKKEISKFVYDVLSKKKISSGELERLLFALYTYGALLMKLLAVSAVTPFFAEKLPNPLAKLAHLEEDKDSEELRRGLRDIESGAWFRRLGIRNLCEGDFFGWYLDEWSPGIVRQIKKVIDVLHGFDPTAVEQTPERVRDLMKTLYHGLLPREVRHALGEYYTPDWLAERVLMLVDSDVWDELEDPGEAKRRQRYAEILPKLTTLRWLDPTCGSGTFLVLIINKIKNQWRRARDVTDAEGRPVLDAPSRAELLRALLNNVHGFDLNPLAVIASRVNWLLSVVDLFDGGEPIEIPVYLADSIALPATGQQNLFASGVYNLPMRGIGEQFPIPTDVATPDNLAKLAAKIGHDVQDGVPTDHFLRGCETMFALPKARWTEAEPALKELYDKLCALEKEGRNGLWAGVAKNMFMPVFAKPYDYVVGNPPWVNWENLPQHYRESTMPLWHQYGLFVHSGMDVMLGKGKKDISMLCAYVATDLYLKPGGRLGFVITQSVFKTSGAAQGFRRFALPDGTGLGVVGVDDFTAFQPFEGATNRTAAFVWRKGSATTYPMRNYREWRKKGPKKPDFWAGWRETQELLRARMLAAEPVDSEDPTSAWLTAPRQAKSGMRKVLGPSEYQARAGAYSGGCNPVYWLEIVRRNPDGTVLVRMITEGAKTEIPPPHQHTIEPDLLYPLLRGRDVKRWSATPEPNHMFLVTQDPAKRVGILEEVMREAYPRTYAYLERYEDVLRQRAAYERYFQPQDPFYSMFNVGEYTFAPYKVVWREVTATFCAAVVGQQLGEAVVPDHKLMLVPLDTPEEAHYVCSMVNSTPFTVAADAYAVGTSRDTHFTKNLHVPPYSRSSRVHGLLATLSQEAHTVTAGGPGRAIGEIESDVDELAAELWGITAKELDALREAARGAP